MKKNSLTPDDDEPVTPTPIELHVPQRFTSQVWADGQNYTFNVMGEEKEGLIWNDYVVLLTGIQSTGENTRIYGFVRDLSQVSKITILVERTVIDPNIS